MEPAVVRRAGPADLIAYIWYELGYQPQESLVIVGLHGNRYRAGAIARCDLPPPHAKRSLLVELARAAVQPLAVHGGATAVMALICSDDALRRPEPPLVPILLREVPRLGLELRDVLGVSATAYRSLLCDDVTCCTPEGHPLADVQTSATAAMQVVAGRTIAGSEGDVIADVRPDDGMEDCLDAGLNIGGGGFDDGDHDADPSDPEAAAEQRWRWWCWWRDELARLRSGETEPDARIKIFWWMLEDLPLRDAILLHAMGAPAQECEALVREPAIGSDWARWDHSLTAAAQRVPSNTGVDVARDLLASSARYARPGRRAPVLSMLAWLAWFQGNGVRSRLLVREALDDREGYSLAMLVDEALLRGAAPPWVAQVRVAPG